LILQAISAAYGAAVTWRRKSYARDPRRVRRLLRPVVSVGNLRAGGSGKTPIVAHIARLLLDMGERPAILTRGYGRRQERAGVTVVSDGTRMLVDVDVAGDEPLMLARALPDVPVLVNGDRYLSGRLAEQHLGATIHLLDDGFQHVALARDVDLLLVDEADLSDRVLPAGHLREPLTAATAASALLVTGGPAGVDRLSHTLAVATAFTVSRAIGIPRMLISGDPVASSDQPVFATAAIARPERFFGDLAVAGWSVAGRLVFRDHHHFTAADLARIAAEARKAGAALVLTTEKDAVRICARDVDGLPIAAVPLAATIEPRDTFREWLFARLATSHSARGNLQSARRSPHAEPLTNPP
jgi:tetraacyldisaccharide 4'-kinase